MNSFPSSFVFGAATSSFQIEGAIDADGRSESAWDRFANTPGAVLNGDTGDPACDHYNRWESDIDVMSELGLGAYRFSVAWPRIIRNDGSVNTAGLDFYDRLVDGLLGAGIEPFLTLYHWDHPQSLEDRGGWRDRSIVAAFVEYTQAVVGRLGDRVTHWFTHNEPWVVAHLGHRTGQHAPGLVNSGTELDVVHHLLLSHGLATQAIRAAAPAARVGITLNLEPRTPRSEHPLDVLAAETEQGLMNTWFLDPLNGREYPRDLAPDWAGDVVREGDLATIAQPLNEFGLNYYRTEVVGDPSVSDDRRPRPIREDPVERSAMGWPVTPDGMRQMLDLLVGYGYESIYVTENGGAFPDDRFVDGIVQDDDRLSYFEQHLRVASQAIADGIPLHGYFAWSLLDNFEWSFGYDRRFGIVHVDFETQQRTIKKSGRWYQDLIAKRS